jgi:hypothetical protein
MIHNKCGPFNKNAPCMVNGKCSKKFPKEYAEETVITENGFPLYKRPNNSINFTNKEGLIFENNWVVPYNKFLLRKFNAHINVKYVQVLLQ